MLTTQESPKQTTENASPEVLLNQLAEDLPGFVIRDEFKKMITKCKEQNLIIQAVDMVKQIASIKDGPKNSAFFTGMFIEGITKGNIGTKEDLDYLVEVLKAKGIDLLRSITGMHNRKGMIKKEDLALLIDLCTDIEGLLDKELLKAITGMRSGKGMMTLKGKEKITVDDYRRLKSFFNEDPKYVLLFKELRAKGNKDLLDIINKIDRQKSLGNTSGYNALEENQNELDEKYKAKIGNLLSLPAEFAVTNNFKMLIIKCEDALVSQVADMVNQIVAIRGSPNNTSFFTSMFGLGITKDRIGTKEDRDYLVEVLKAKGIDLLRSITGMYNSRGMIKKEDLALLIDLCTTEQGKEFRYKELDKELLSLIATTRQHKGMMTLSGEKKITADDYKKLKSFFTKNSKYVSLFKNLRAKENTDLLDIISKINHRYQKDYPKDILNDAFIQSDISSILDANNLNHNSLSNIILPISDVVNNNVVSQDNHVLLPLDANGLANFGFPITNQYNPGIIYNNSNIATSSNNDNQVSQGQGGNNFLPVSNIDNINERNVFNDYNALISQNKETTNLEMLDSILSQETTWQPALNHSSAAQYDLGDEYVPQGKRQKINSNSSNQMAQEQEENHFIKSYDQRNPGGQSL